MSDIFSYLQKEVLFNSIDLVADRHQEFYKENYSKFKSFKDSITHIMQNYNMEDAVNDPKTESYYDTWIKGIDDLQWDIFNVFTLKDFDDLKQSLSTIADPNLNDVLAYIDRAKQKAIEIKGLEV